MACPSWLSTPGASRDPSVTTVGATNWSGGFAATRYLVELGHRRIGMISGPTDLLCSRARMDGYRSAMEAADLPLDPDLMQWGDFHVDGGFKEAMAMLSLAHRPTAIFAGSDLQALGVLEAARILQVTVPSQLSLVGFDDLPLSRWTSPPLTTVRQPLAEMAATAVRLVLAEDLGGPPRPAAWSWPRACCRGRQRPRFRLEGGCRGHLGGRSAGL